MCSISKKHITLDFYWFLCCDVVVWYKKIFKEHTMATYTVLIDLQMLFMFQMFQIWHLGQFFCINVFKNQWKLPQQHPTTHCKNRNFSILINRAVPGFAVLFSLYKAPLVCVVYIILPCCAVPGHPWCITAFSARFYGQFKLTFGWYNIVLLTSKRLENTYML